MVSSPPRVGKTRTGLITVPHKKSRYKIIVGIDFNHPAAHNEIGYIRFADTENRRPDGVPKTVRRELWLSLEDLDKLGTLLILFSRYWAKTRRKTRESEKEAQAFIKFWKMLRSEWPKLKKFIPKEERD
jgi:hypothetical protein